MHKPDVIILGLRDYRGAQGGVETHVRGLVDNLPTGNPGRIEVVVRSRYAPETAGPDETRVKAVSLWSPKSKYLEAIIHSALGVVYAAMRRPKVLHIHAVGPAIVTPFARMLGLKVVFTHHGEDYKREKWGARSRLVLRLGEYFGMRMSNEVISIGRALTTDLEKRYERKVHFIPNGVKLPSGEPGLSALEQYGLTPGKYFLNVARFVPEKRQLDLIRAFRNLDLPDYKLVLVGAADHSSDFAREVLEEAANTPGVICTGALSGSPLQELYSHAGVFLLPSSHEGLPLVLLEALSYNLPVVMSDIPALTDLGLPAHWYHTVADVASLEDRIREAVTTGFPDHAAIAQDFLKRFRWPDIAEATRDVYRKVAADSFSASDIRDAS